LARCTLACGPLACLHHVRCTLEDSSELPQPSASQVPSKGWLRRTPPVLGVRGDVHVAVVRATDGYGEETSSNCPVTEEPSKGRGPHHSQTLEIQSAKDLHVVDVQRRATLDWMA